MELDSGICVLEYLLQNETINCVHHIMFAFVNINIKSLHYVTGFGTSIHIVDFLH